MNMIHSHSYMFHSDKNGEKLSTKEVHFSKDVHLVDPWILLAQGRLHLLLESAVFIKHISKKYPLAFLLDFQSFHYNEFFGPLKSNSPVNQSFRR